MNYVDLDGNIIRENSRQDRLLSLLYTTTVGRVLLKPMVHPALSGWAGKFLSTEFSSRLIPFFIKRCRLDLSEYEPAVYSSFNDFFTRKILSGRRPICPEPDILISPCDCRATVYPIAPDSVFTIKNTSYSLKSLLHSPSLASRFCGGYAFVLRLTVSDYHRYTYAVSGEKSKNYHIPGVFHTVNPVANDYAPVYIQNTREYSVIHSAVFGDVIQMEVGALLVGKIKNLHGRTFAERGCEKGFFEYGGSTIVVLVKKDRVVPRSDLTENTEKGLETKILQGQKLGISCNT